MLSHLNNYKSYNYVTTHLILYLDKDTKIILFADFSTKLINRTLYPFISSINVIFIFSNLSHLLNSKWADAIFILSMIYMPSLPPVKFLLIIVLLVQ